MFAGGDEVIEQSGDFRSWHLADITGRAADVRYRVQCGRRDVAHPIPDCSVTSVTFAAALDCVKRQREARQQPTSPSRSGRYGTVWQGKGESSPS